MRVITETKLQDFQAWLGGKETLEKIIGLNLCEQIEQEIEELYPDGITGIELNDYLWFDEELNNRLFEEEKD